jgi:ParB/RepB/Spo0J family partition protein
MKVSSIELSKIDQNENSRAIYKASDLSELMTSIKKHGLLQPVGVAKTSGGRFEAVFGNRRILAARKLGWDSIHAHVYSSMDEAQRDVLNLVENFKRQPTTAAEDGRIFQSLLDRGLTVDEICSRVEVTKARVETAIGALRDFPEEYRRLIVNKPNGGARKDAGKIAASAAYQILNLKKNHNLDTKQTRRLLEMAKKEPSTKIAQIAPLMRGGLDVEDAIEQATEFESIALRVYIPASRIERIERKHGKSINEFIYDLLEANPELKAKRWLGTNVVKALPAQASA